MKLRILYVCHHLPEPLGGAARTSTMLAQAMERRGHEVDTWYANDLLTKHHSERLRELLLAGLLRLRAKSILELQPDVIDVSGGYGWRLFRAVAGQPIVRVARSYGLEAADWKETLADASMGRANVRMRARVFRGWWQLHEVVRSAETSDLFVAPTESAVKNMSGKVPGLTGEATSLGIEPDVLNTKPRTPPGNFRILFVGSWIARKGIKDLVEAVSQFMIRDDSAQLHILGSGVESSTILRGFSETLRQRVTVHGWLPREELLETMSGCSVCLAPSVSEGFGLSSLEAMALGLPVISTPTGFFEGSDQRKMATIVPKRSPESILQGLLEVRAGSTAVNQSRKCGQAWARRQTWDSVAAKTESAYLRQMSGRPSIGGDLMRLSGK